MDEQYRLTDLHLDVLEEIGNIGAAHAATALSTLLARKIDMHVPNVELVSFDEMFEVAGGAETVVAGIYLRIEGDLTGNMFFVLPLDSANHLIRLLLSESYKDEKCDPLSNELGISALQEVGNILAGSYLSALSDFTKLKITPTVPSIGFDMVGAIVSYGLIEASRYSDEIIVINTQIEEAGEARDTSIEGRFFLLPDPPSYQTIFRSLGVL
ncbi:chemotaxis protein CheC [Sporosarcina sp. HYO08]|uniref:chemotaxis protein CheC n=1 Tax=Sporosarcina sp. HYO08 TaxID=1759557 RepID=UPI000793273B|nr:chemotaxis protein CheC [Sporosarcina sp. HYO08]KXH80003.1 CheY-P-specific phosphatase CheC [Sporosarcina sp. HYO08]